ncbi:7946_t:CDS:2, partial [Gigaspora rosea]
GITIDPVPYSPYDSFQEKLLQTAPSPTKKLIATRNISDYYKKASIR